MSELILLGEEKRKQGTGNSRALRRNQRIPGVVYGFNENYTISLAYQDFIREYQKGNLLSKSISLQINSKLLRVITREIQIDPLSDNPIHVDFQLIKEGSLVRVPARVRIKNVDRSPGIKKGGVLNIVKKYIDFNCTSQNILHHLEIDISGFEIGRNICINDVHLPQGVSPVDKDNFTIVTISGRSEEKESQEKEGSEENQGDTKK